MPGPARVLPQGLSAAPLDGIAVFYCDDLEAARKPATDPELTEHGKLDERSFLDLERLKVIETQPAFTKPTSGSPAVKAIALVARAVGAAIDDFRKALPLGLELIEFFGASTVAAERSSIYFAREHNVIALTTAVATG
jgi:hypothetical protein